MIMLSNTTNLSATSLTIQRSTRLFTRSIFRIVNNFVAAIVAQRERQANLIILRSLSDRDLKDIGLCRNQIGGDLTEANATFLDGTGHPVGTTSPFQYNFGSVASSLFTITIGNMQNFPQAVSVSLTVIDNSANASAPITASFGNADPGGPTVNSVTFDGRNDLMIVKGGGFTGQAGAICQGVARALKRMFGLSTPPAEGEDPVNSMAKKLRDSGYLTRDGRMKERKIYGRKGARKAFQFSKR